MDDRIWQRRVAAALIVAFAMLTTVLAMIGLYGILSYVIQQQTRDIGVRLALRATASSIAAGVLCRGLGLAALGTGIGIALAFALSRTLSGLLYGVSFAVPLTFAGVPLLVFAVAAAACYFPARRATGVESAVALQSDG